LYRWIEEEILHFRELADGSIMVCGQTLASQINEMESAVEKNAISESITLALEANVQEASIEELPGWLTSPQIFATNTDH
jgi:hypothetical protein